MDQSHLKVHRRKPFLDGRAFTTLSPRPDEGPRLTVDLTTEPPQLHGDQVSSALFGQLCWAMAYQRSGSTVAVIDGAGTPVVIANTDLDVPTPEWLDELRPMVPWSVPSEGTINLNTRSLESAVANEPAFYADQKRDGIGDIKHQSRFVTAVGGAALLAAPGIVLKSWGVQLSTPDDQRPTWFVVAGA